MRECISREEALLLLKKYNKEAFHIQHALTVEGVLRWYAKELGYGDEENYWGITGLLHDIDFELYPEEHCQKAPELLREAGATEVHFMVSSPPFLFPCYYGTDVPDKDMLIANQHTKEEIREMIGVDSLNYLDLEDMKKIALMDGKNSFCYACFDGKYSTEIPVQQEKYKFETYER